VFKEEEGLEVLRDCWVTLVALEPNRTNPKVKGKVFLMNLKC
jgi:hypothetical protein